MNAAADNLSRSGPRIAVVGLLFGLFFIAVSWRSYDLQILGNDKLNRLVSSQYNAKVVISPKRGTIYDRNGEPLAMDVLVASVSVHPHQVVDKISAAQALMEATGLSAAEIERKLNSSSRFEWVKRRIPIENGDALEAKKIVGIEVDHEYKRFYPNKSLAGQVLGAVGYDAKALGGLELEYDSILRSDQTRMRGERDARGRYYELDDSAIAGNSDIRLTLDLTVQNIAEQALRANAIKHNVKSGFAIVLDAKTAEILAVANYPTFNPNAYRDSPQEVWRDHAAQDSFEPGSTFKAMLMAAALKTGKVHPNDKFFCENGSYRIGDHTIHDAHHGHGTITASEILKVSSNIGVTKIAQKIGRSDYYDFIKSIGFGKKTPVGMLGESSGLLRDAKNWREIEFSNITFGQGVAVTGLQMASAYQTFANDGVQLAPYLVQEITGPDGRVIQRNGPRPVGQMLSEKSASDLREMLYGVTQTGGTAPAANIDGYRAGGKTGTAQKVDPNTHTYAQNQYVSSFIGFAPLNDPKLVIYVVYDTPRQNGYYGGVVAAPVFKSIATDVLAYMGVAPDHLQDLATSKVAKVAP